MLENVKEKMLENISGRLLGNTTEEPKETALENEKKLLLIVNPNAGVRKRENALGQILLVFSDYGYVTTVCFTQTRGDATGLVVKYANEGFDMIVCIGGDGTLNETLAGALQVKWEKALGYIPAGSTNDFASSLGIPSDVIEAAKRIMEGKMHKFDMGKFNDRTFVYTACCGIFTKTSYATPQVIKNRLGHFAYVLEGMKDLNPYKGGVKPVAMEIDTGEQVYTGNYLFAAICNTYSLGGVMTLDESDISLSDGMFEMLLIRVPDDLMEFNGIIRCLRDQTYDSPYVTMAKVKNATIKYLSDEDWSLDGERGDTKEINTFTVIHDAVGLVY